MTIEIRMVPGGEFAGEVVSDGSVLRFAGWLGLLRALSSVIATTEPASTSASPTS